MALVWTWSKFQSRCHGLHLISVEARREAVKNLYVEILQSRLRL